MERFVNRFKVCSEILFILVHMHMYFSCVRQTHTYSHDAEEEKEDSCSLFASLMEFN